MFPGLLNLKYMVNEIKISTDKKIRTNKEKTKWKYQTEFYQT